MQEAKKDMLNLGWCSKVVAFYRFFLRHKVPHLHRDLGSPGRICSGTF